MNVFLEGYSFVGKTTLLNALRLNNAPISIIDEHDVYADGIGNYPTFPSATPADAIENVSFFYNLEQIRHNDSLDATTALFDRSIFSVILFQKYIKSLNLQNHASAYEFAKEEATQLIESNAVAVPDYIVYLSAEYSDVVERYGREISVGLLRGQAAHEFFQNEYEKIISIYEKYNRSLRIVSRNTPDSVSDQTSLVRWCKYYERKRKINYENTCARFC
jgi:deoxyadenosine/deoxycytidine kinase